jgi:hypothetical protein
MIDNSVLVVTFDDVVKFNERLYTDYPSLDTEIVKILKMITQIRLLSLKK